MPALVTPLIVTACEGLVTVMASEKFTSTSRMPAARGSMKLLSAATRARATPACALTERQSLTLKSLTTTVGVGNTTVRSTAVPQVPSRLRGTTTNRAFVGSLVLSKRKTLQ
jgi:hypothetical protein